MGVTSAGARSRPPLILVFSITLTGILANTLIVAPLPDIIEDFDLGDGAAGLVVAAATLPGIVIAPVIGLLADRFGRRMVLIPCLVVFGVAGMGAAFSPSFAVLLAMRLLQGVGSAGLINLAVVLLGDYWEGTERARLIGYNAAVLTVSVALFPALGGVLAQVGNWRWSFAPYGIAIVTALAVWLLLPRRDVTQTISVSNQVRAAVAVLKRPVVFGAVSFGFVLFVLIFGLFLTAMPILLEDDFGLDAGVRGLILAFPAAGSTFAALTLGWSRKRFGARRLLLFSTMLFVLGFVAIGLADVLVLLFGGALLYGLGEGASIPTVQDLVAGAAPEASRGAVVAAWVGAARAGQTIGPLLAGGALETLGPSTTFVVGGAVAAVMLVLQIVVRLDRVALRPVETPGVSSAP